ncbi:hypothetical protein [Spirosoma aerolatum]|uniref:hypothetical protein n=1 Tax=Spirosoma aerolatum TaxID=1211326 RepID=UPI0014742081|nr:hypothetical protein [Spirosoma aerolatum]
MAQRPLKWLSDFEYRYKPSLSFLNCMDQQLRYEYTQLTNKTFDVQFLFIEFQDDLQYINDPNEALLKASQRYKGNYPGECIITWRHNFEDRFVLPDEEIQIADIAFKWRKLVCPDLSFLTTKPSNSISQRLGLTLSYILKEDSPSGLDVELRLQLADPSIVKSLEQQLAVLQANWNEQALQDTTRQKGYIHSVSLAREEEGEYVFQIDLGSAANEGLKVILNEFNNPKWGITQVEIV